MLLATCLALAGCDRGMFRADGALASDGGNLGHWSERPQGCTRDPWDGKSPAETSEVVTFLWEDAFNNVEVNPGMRRQDAQDAPLRLDLYRVGGVPVGRLQTVVNAGIRLDQSVCARVEVEADEQAPAYRGGRPALRGRVRLDCRVGGGHLTADIGFEHCEF